MIKIRINYKLKGYMEHLKLLLEKYADGEILNIYYI